MATPAQLFTENANFDVQRHRQLQDEQRQFQNGIDIGVINNPYATDDEKNQAYARVNARYPTPAHAPQFLIDMLHLKGKQQQAQQAQQAQSAANVATNTPPTSDATTTSAPPSITNPAQVLQGGVAPQVAQQVAAQPSATTPAPTTPSPDQMSKVRAIAQAKSPQEAMQMIQSLPQPPLAAQQSAGPLAGYASPQEIQNALAARMAAIQHQNQMELYGLRGQTAENVATIHSMYAMLNTPQKMYLESQANAAGYPSFYQMPAQLQGGLLTQFHNANSPKIETDFVQDANSPTGWSRATYNPITQETYDVYPGVKPPPGLVARHRVTTTPGPNGMVTTVSDITPSLPGGAAQPFTPPTPKGEKQSTAGGPQGTPKAPPVSTATPTGPLEGVSAPPNGGTVNSTAPEAGTPPASAATTAAAPPVNAGARQPGTKPQGGAVKGPKLAPPVPQRPDSGGEEIPPLRNPGLPPLKGADEARIASITAPVHTVEAQVVGRGRKPLWELAEVLKNPEMLRAVNTAMLAPMLQTPEGNHNVSFWGTIATSLGLASAAQQATSDVITEARNKVRQDGGPQALQLLDRLAELKGTIPNLRKVQGGSNALGALEPLYQESPLMNISSPEDFQFRTANMLRTMADSLSEQPGVNRKHVDWLYGQAEKAEKGGAPQVAPTGKGSPNVDNFLKNFGKK